jgi:hypothetical protein
MQTAFSRQQPDWAYTVRQNPRGLSKPACPRPSLWRTLAVSAPHLCGELAQPTTQVAEEVYEGLLLASETRRPHGRGQG